MFWKARDMDSAYNSQVSLAALRAFLAERSPLGPLKVMAANIGRFFQIPLPGFKPYVVFGPEANRKVLVTERDKLLWRNHDPVTDLLRRGVLVTDGEEHDHYRKIMEPSLHPSRLDGYTQMMIEKNRQVTESWKEGQTVDMLVESRKLALLIIMQALFNVEVWNDLPRIWTPTLKAIEYISPGTWILWRKIPRPGYKKHLRILDEYLYNIIANRRQIIESACNENQVANSQLPTPDLLQHLIDAGLDDNTIRDQMLTMLIAGHDTSTALLAWTFALLGQHPDIHRQLVADLENDDRPPLLDQVIRPGHQGSPAPVPAHPHRQPHGSKGYGVRGRRRPGRVAYVLLDLSHPARPGRLGKRRRILPGPLRARAKNPVFFLCPVRRRAARLHRRGVRPG
jgi:cytochrome P450